MNDVDGISEISKISGMVRAKLTESSQKMNGEPKLFRCRAEAVE